MKSIYYFLFFILLINSCTDPTRFSISSEQSDAPIRYGIEKFEQFLSDHPEIKNQILRVSTRLDTTLEAEAYKINIGFQEVEIVGGDPVGVLYGLQNVREQLQQNNQHITEHSAAPRFPFRAIKFNLPWSSYRNGEALQQHTETCRDTAFWESFLDMMVENRFNKLTLWNLHPFSYVVKTEKYPEASGFSDAELKTWQTFWRTLFRMAKDRGIETYLINWNIFVSPEFAKAHNVATYSIDNQYFIKQGDTSEIVKDYTRESVKAVIDEYPNLTGLGITLGEGMGGMTADEREQWLLDSYIEGMRMASRKVKFIHRVPLSAGKESSGSTSFYVEKMTRQTLDTLTAQDGIINIELKFNWSHAHSTPHLAKVHGGELSDTYWNPLPENYRLAWMMRNEDFFALRWGQADFIRDHIKRNGHPYVNGCYVGSETYIPAKDYFTTLPNTSYKYAFERQWMFYKMWGRLLYNPELSDQYFKFVFEDRFPEDGTILFDAQRKVSQIPLIIASYWNATWDYTLYSEGMLSSMGNKKGRVQLLSLQQLIDKTPMEPRYVSVKDFLLEDFQDTPDKITPIELADSIAVFCTAALEEVEKISTEANNDLLYEVSDIQAWARLGLYFAHKLKAAVAYQQFKQTKEKEFLQQSVYHLEQATNEWKQLVEVTSPIYRPMPLQHYEKNDHALFHWSEVQEEVDAELDAVKRELDGSK